MCNYKWIPFADLKFIDKDIAEYGYSKPYIESNSQLRTKFVTCETISGKAVLYEPLEVKEIDGEIFCRELNEEPKKSPTVFDSQFGRFNNHDNGEFYSWLGKDEHKESNPKLVRLYGREDYYIEGNYKDLFDCGRYSYAISNLRHMMSGWFKIVRIDNDLTPVTMYDNRAEDEWLCLEFDGRIAHEDGYLIVVSGYKMHPNTKPVKEMIEDKTILFRIDDQGNCVIWKDWPICIASSNSIARAGNYLFFGNNKMITRLDIESGQLTYYTNKSDMDLAALSPV